MVRFARLGTCCLALLDAAMQTIHSIGGHVSPPGNPVAAASLTGLPQRSSAMHPKATVTTSFNSGGIHGTSARPTRSSVLSNSA